MAFIPSIPPAEETVGAVIGRFPDQGIPLTQLTEVVMRSGESAFSAEQRELIAAFVSGTNDCTFCYGTHRATAESFGVDASLLEALLTNIDEADIDDALKPVLRFARKLTLTPAKVTQADADAVFAAGWSEREFHFTVMITALFNLYNRLMDGYGVRNTAGFRQERGAVLAESGYGWIIDLMREGGNSPIKPPPHSGS